MGIFIAFWIALLVVLIIGLALGIRQFDDYRNLIRKSREEVDPILRIKERWDTGQLTREQFEVELRNELEHPREPKQKTG